MTTSVSYTTISSGFTYISISSSSNVPAGIYARPTNGMFDILADDGTIRYKGFAKITASTYSSGSEAILDYVRNGLYYYLAFTDGTATTGGTFYGDASSRYTGTVDVDNLKGITGGSISSSSGNLKVPAYPIITVEEVFNRITKSGTSSNNSTNSSRLTGTLRKCGGTRATTALLTQAALYDWFTNGGFDYKYGSSYINDTYWSLWNSSSTPAILPSVRTLYVVSPQFSSSSISYSKNQAVCATDVLSTITPQAKTITLLDLDFTTATLNSNKEILIDADKTATSSYATYPTVAASTWEEDNSNFQHFDPSVVPFYRPTSLSSDDSNTKNLLSTTFTIPTTATSITFGDAALLAYTHFLLEHHNISALRLDKLSLDLYLVNSSGTTYNIGSIMALNDNLSEDPISDYIYNGVGGTYELIRCLLYNTDKTTLWRQFTVSTSALSSFLSSSRQVTFKVDVYWLIGRKINTYHGYPRFILFWGSKTFINSVYFRKQYGSDLTSANLEMINSTFLDDVPLNLFKITILNTSTNTTSRGLFFKINSSKVGALTLYLGTVTSTGLTKSKTTNGSVGYIKLFRDSDYGSTSPMLDFLSTMKNSDPYYISFDFYAYLNSNSSDANLVNSSKCCKIISIENSTGNTSNGVPNIALEKNSTASSSIELWTNITQATSETKSNLFRAVYIWNGNRGNLYIYKAGSVTPISRTSTTKALTYYNDDNVFSTHVLKNLLYDCKDYDTPYLKFLVGFTDPNVSSTYGLGWVILRIKIERML